MESELHLSTDKHNGDEVHNLLETPSIAYSSVTVRRAFVVWMYCGQTNKFKDVCNYYHYLEALEETLPEETRASSRQHEFSLFSGRPPLSPYVANNFPTLYPAATQLMGLNEAKVDPTKHDTIKTQDINKTAQGNGTTKQEILEASRMIRDYCRRNMKSFKGFLNEFKMHSQRCGLSNTVGNIALYIKRKIIQSEIQLEANYSKTLELLSRLNEDVDEISVDHQIRCKSEQCNSLILKEADPLDIIPVPIKKNSNEGTHKMTTKIINSKPDEDLKEDFENSASIHNKCDIKYSEKSYIRSIAYDIFDTLIYGNRHETELRTRKFSDSDLITIREDVMKSRNI